MSADFCDECGVTLDLHMDRDEFDADDCDQAGRKADLMDMFFRSVGGQR